MWKKIATYFLSSLMLLNVVLPALADDANVGDAPVDDTNSVGSGISGAMKDRLNVITNNVYNKATTATTAQEYVGYVLTVVFSLFGVIFLALTIYAGYNWMTAQGDAGKVKTAQTTLRVAVIGLIITIAAYAIWQFIFVRIVSGVPE